MSSSDAYELAQQIRDQVMLPALQAAAARAQEISSSPEIFFNAAVESFAELLFQLVGPVAAAHVLRALADHIATKDTADTAGQPMS